MIHINDLHIGVVRSGGTTPLSSYRLRQYALDCFGLLLDSISEDLIINGDLFDTFNVPLADFLAAYWRLRDWLRRTGKILILVPGNHDFSKNVNVKSSFAALSELLQRDYPDKVMVFNEPGAFRSGGVVCYVIPHVANQELFDKALANVPECRYLFLHCNFDNRFTAQQDHSLNISPDQARAIPAGRIIVAHEHQRKIALAGHLILPGNQFPTSVADCLGNHEKYLLRLVPGRLEYIVTWHTDSGVGRFKRVDWRELDDIDPALAFIRIEGQATAGEAPLVVQAVSKLRATHQAFVITNAVEVESENGDGFKVSLDQIKSFNVLTALLKYLNEDEGRVVTNLLEKDQHE